MADDRERDQGMKQGTGQAGHQAPGRNPQDDRTAAERGNQGREQGSQEPGQGSREDKQASERGGFDPSEGGDGGSYKEGGQNEQSRR